MHSDECNNGHYYMIQTSGDRPQQWSTQLTHYDNSFHPRWPHSAWDDYTLLDAIIELGQRPNGKVFYVKKEDKQIKKCFFENKK